MLTNYHVAVGAIPEYYGSNGNYRIDASKPLELSNENGKFYARVLDSDKSADLALLVVCDKNGKDTGEKLPQFFIIDNGGPELGENVFSLGYPAGTSENDKPAFTTGKIDGTVTAPGGGVMIRHFSDIQPGYSGGPLVYMDKDDVVAGVNASGRVSDDNELKGANYAVSAAEIRKRFPVIFSGGAAE